ncbi:hypothetical protein Goshw_004410, partial [Gossypium schwendimanii]|nr:hypothetical protein [Gossypium schwendimanii]
MYLQAVPLNLTKEILQYP